MKIMQAEALQPSTVKLTYESGEIRYFDVSPYCNSAFFSELKDWEYFRQVKPTLWTVEWPHGQDFAPETLYQESKEVVKV